MNEVNGGDTSFDLIKISLTLVHIYIYMYIYRYQYYKAGRKKGR